MTQDLTPLSEYLHSLSAVQVAIDSWGHILFWELYQQSKIREANKRATVASRNASRAAQNAQQVSHSIRMLEDKIDSLSLTCQALWELLRDRTKLTEEELCAKISEIDLRDGQADGKMGVKGGPCSKCGRVLNQRHLRCIYCGEHKSKDHLFQT